jgi:serine/threonine protein phosphatase PrpC
MGILGPLKGRRKPPGPLAEPEPILPGAVLLRPPQHDAFAELLRAPPTQVDLPLPTSYELRAAIETIRGTPPILDPNDDQQETLRRAESALEHMESLYKDGSIEPYELGPLTRSALAISNVLTLRDTPEFEDLDWSKREHLEAQLFTPLDGLSKLALKHADRGVNATLSNEMGQVLAELNQVPGIYAAAAGETASSLMRTGGAETLGVELMMIGHCSAAIFTHRGFDPYNEDAVGVGHVGGTMFITADDQAGKHGKISGRDGAASELAARAFEEAAALVEAGAIPAAAIRKCALEAHKAILKLNKTYQTNAVTTFAGALVKDGVAYAASCGDSQVLHFSKDGRLKNCTRPDNVMTRHVEASRDRSGLIRQPNAMIDSANKITAGLGMVDYRGRGIDLAMNVETWAVEPGDYLVTVTDGVLDANLEAARIAVFARSPWTEFHEDVTRQDLGALVRQAAGAEDVARSFAGYAIRQALSLMGKKDNLSVAALQVR